MQPKDQLERELCWPSTGQFVRVVRQDSIEWRQANGAMVRMALLSRRLREEEAKDWCRSALVANLYGTVNRRQQQEEEEEQQEAEFGSFSEKRCLYFGKAKLQACCKHPGSKDAATEAMRAFN